MRKQLCLFLLLSLFALWSCNNTPEEQTDTTNPETNLHDDYQEKYNDLNQTYATYKQKYAELEGENENLKKDTSRLKNHILELEHDKKRVTVNLRTKLRTIENLKKELEKQKERFDKGEITQDEFGDILSSYEEVNQTLDEDNIALQALAQENENLREQVQRQSDEVELSRNQVEHVTPVKEFALYYYRSKGDKKKKLKTPLDKEAQHEAGLVKQAIYLDVEINKDLMYYQQGVWEINEGDAGVKIFASLLEKGKKTPLHHDLLILDEHGAGELALQGVGLQKGKDYTIRLSIGEKVLKEQAFTLE